jgi:predicted transposase YbfD/YdcC
MATPSTPSICAHFADLPDPRIHRTRRHNLLDIVFITLCAAICGANDFVAIEKFGKTKRRWLSQYLELPNGIPSHDTFGRVVAALNPDKFVECFVSWVQSLSQATRGQFINLDGKTARATLDKAKGQTALHVVSAWATQNRLVLGQVAVDEKSNEITAIPKLLDMLDLAGAIVTIDAMGCQKDIAAKIRDGGADYVLAVKGNQETLEQEVRAAFDRVDEGKRSRSGLSVSQTHEQGHGREDARYCEALPVPHQFGPRQQWRDIRSLCRVTRVYKGGGKNLSEVRYFISSLKPRAAKLAAAVRGHWGIENGLHWVLDMYLGEDRSRARSGHAAENLALLRRWVISMLRQDTTLQGGIEKKRLQAGWDDNNLEKLLGLS